MRVCIGSRVRECAGVRGRGCAGGRVRGYVLENETVTERMCADVARSRGKLCAIALGACVRVRARERARCHAKEL